MFSAEDIAGTTHVCRKLIDLIEAPIDNRATRAPVPSGRLLLLHLQMMRCFEPLDLLPVGAGGRRRTVFLLTRENHELAPSSECRVPTPRTHRRVSEGPQELRYAFSDTEIPEEKQMARLAYTVYSPKVR